MVEVVPGRVVGGIAEPEVRPEVDDRLPARPGTRRSAPRPRRGAARGTRPRRRRGRRRTRAGRSSRGAGGCRPIGSPCRSRPTRPDDAGRGDGGRGAGSSSAPDVPRRADDRDPDGLAVERAQARRPPPCRAAGSSREDGPPRSPRPSSPRSPARAAAHRRQAHGLGDRAERDLLMTIQVRCIVMQHSATTGAAPRYGQLGEVGRLGLELLVVQPRVQAAAGDQLAVRAALDDPAALEDEDPVGAQDRRQAVGDRDRRPALGEAPERRLDQPLADRVERRRRLVEDQDLAGP